MDIPTQTSSAFGNVSSPQVPSAPVGIPVSGNAPPQQQQPIQPQIQSQPQKVDMSEWEPVQQNNTNQKSSIDLSEWEPVQKQPTTLGSIASGVGDKITDRLASQGKAQEQFMSGNMDNIDKAAFGVKTAINTPIGIGNDVIGGLLQAAAHEAPDVVKDKAEQALQSFLSTDTGKFAVSALQKGGQAWDNLQQTHPDAAEFLTGIGNVGSIIGVGAGGKAVGKVAADVAADTADVAGKAMVETAAGEYTQFKDMPNMGSKLSEYAKVAPSDIAQPNVASDEVAKTLVEAQKKLNQFNSLGNPTDAAGIAQKAQLEKTVNDLRAKVYNTDRTNAAFRPAEAATEAPIPNATPPVDKNIPLSEQLRKQSSAKYNSIGNAEMPSSTMDKFLSDVKSSHPEDTELAAATGKTPEQQYISDLSNLQGKPLPLQRAKSIYEDLGEKADKNILDNGHPTNEGRIYQSMQGKLWDAIEGTPGTSQWQEAKKDWQQSIKLSALEKMEAQAANKAQPANSLRTAIGNFVASGAKTRGWSDDEVSALKQIGDMSTKEEMLRQISSRLIPHVIGGMGAAIGAVGGGPLGAATGVMLGELAGVPLATAARNSAFKSTTSKLDTAKAAVLKNTSNKGEGLLQQLKKK